jgi:hypothetical protein
LLLSGKKQKEERMPGKSVTFGLEMGRFTSDQTLATSGMSFSLPVRM